MESERWYRIHFLTSALALSLYVSFAIIWDFIIQKTSNVTAGKLNATITALLSSLLQFGFLNWKYRLSAKLFRLKILRENYSFWVLRYLKFRDRTKSIFEFKFLSCLLYFFSAVVSVFIFLISAICSYKFSSSSDYYCNKWFALAGALVLPMVRLFTSFIYVPNRSYSFFFRI